MNNKAPPPTKAKTAAKKAVTSPKTTASKETAAKAAATKTPPPPAPPRPFAAPRQIAGFVPSLTRKAFEKYGFSAVALITDWTEIVGRELATYTAPERLKWPRAPEGEPSEDMQQRKRDGAVLTLRVDGARALEMEYRRAEVAERVNAYFGYRAVGDVRILQAPIDVKPVRKRLIPTAADASPLPDVTDPALREALEKLGRGLKAKSRVTNKPDTSK
ncbi:MAG: DciA family protein [Hyphomicrobiaceae bacterium]|nr:DUF721 domain-containing protein [Hyphomicrobiaceae bacterium]